MARSVATPLVLLTAVVYAGAGCATETSVAPALMIVIEDSATGEPRAYGATVTVRDGDFVEIKHGADYSREAGETLFAAWGRPGTYSITVTHPGYLDWHMEEVIVSEGSRSPFDGSVQPKPVEVHARLQPSQ